MGVETAIIAGVAVAGDVYGMVESHKSQGSASDAAYDKAQANILRNKEQLLQTQRNREETIRKTRATQASVTNSAISAGVDSGDSGVAAGLSSLSSQTADNIGTSYQLEALEKEAVDAENRAILEGNAASNESQNSQFGFGLGKMVGGISSGFGELFGTGGAASGAAIAAA